MIAERWTGGEENFHVMAMACPSRTCAEGIRLWARCVPSSALEVSHLYPLHQRAGKIAFQTSAAVAHVLALITGDETRVNMFRRLATLAKHHDLFRSVGTIHGYIYGASFSARHRQRLTSTRGFDRDYRGIRAGERRREMRSWPSIPARLW